MHKVFEFISKKKEAVFLAIAVSFGSLLSIVLNLNSNSSLSPQDSLSILMSHDILNGDFMLMRYGQPSIGAIEQYLGALVGLILPYSVWIVFIPRLILFLGTSHILWWFFKRTNHNKEMQVVAALLWVSVSFSLFHVGGLYGSAMTALFLNTIGLYLGYYAAHSLRNVRFYFAWAFVSGLALWASIFSLLFIIPIFIWILYSARALLKKTFLAIVLFILGSLPWWIFNVSNSFASLQSLRSDFAQPIPIADKQSNFDISRIIGISPSMTDSWKNDFLAVLLIVIFSASFLYLILMLVLGINSVLKEKRQYSNFTYLTLAILVLSVVVELSFVIYKGESVVPRFVSLVCIVFFLMALKKTWLQTSLLLIALLFVSIGHFINSDVPKLIDKTTKSEIVSELRDSEIKLAVAPFEYAHFLEVKSQGDTKFAPFDQGFFDQDRTESVNSNLDAIIVRKGNFDDQWFSICVQAVVGEGFERKEVGDLYVYFVPDRFQKEIASTVTGCRNSNFLSKTDY